MKLEAKARLASSVVTAAGRLDSLPPRKREVTDRVMSILSEAGLEPTFSLSHSGSANLTLSKSMSFLKLAKLVKAEFTFHGASHGTKGFMAYNFSDNGKSPFVICGWDNHNEVTIAQPRTQWTPAKADLPEFSILALRQNLEALTGVKLKPMISKKTGGLTLKGALKGKQDRKQIMDSLKRAGKMKSIRVKNLRGGIVNRQVVYISKAGATAMVVPVGGPDAGHFELVIS